MYYQFISIFVQQLLKEGPSMLHYTYIACLVITQHILPIYFYFCATVAKGRPPPRYITRTLPVLLLLNIYYQFISIFEAHICVRSKLFDRIINVYIYFFVVQLFFFL